MTYNIYFESSKSRGARPILPSAPSALFVKESRPRRRRLRQRSLKMIPMLCVGVA